jgi:hypothetical protein
VVFRVVSNGGLNWCRTTVSHAATEQNGPTVVSIMSGDAHRYRIVGLHGDWSLATERFMVALPRVRGTYFYHFQAQFQMVRAT